MGSEAGRGGGRSRSNGSHLDGRGQTGVDFLVGVGVFILTVGFAVAFAPGMFSPFVEGQAQPLAADRAADTLVGALLVGERPSTLDTACTLAFFGVGSATCPFEPSETTGDGLARELGLTDPTSERYNSVYRVNVTLERGVAGSPESVVLCGSDAPSPSVHDCSTGTRLAVGPPPDRTTASVVVATRVVRVDETDATLVVRVW